MAAYAALVSLMNTMEQIQNHPRHSTSFDKKQIESLGEKVGFLQDFMEGYSHGGSKEEQVLESQIASAAHAAEDVIESHVVDQILDGSTGHEETNSSFLLDLQKVIEDMDSVKEKVMEVKGKRGFKYQLPTNSILRLLCGLMECMDFIKEKIMMATSSRPLTTRKNTMVGFDDELIQLMDVLTGQQSNQEIIPIVGMGGIGKTTLARNAFENSLIVQHFDIRAWVTVSQESNLREVLLELLSCHKEQANSEMNQKNENQLGEQLHRSLYGRRYLIILDDMWSIEVWEKLKFFFPNNGNGSRIVVTTRLLDVACHFGSSCLVMNFLDDNKSWNLFCEVAFAQESCPPEFDEIGKRIVRTCKGLPLSIVIIGGLLGKSSRTLEYWKNVARDINSILNSEEEDHCLKILSLSYNHLPAHLKPCFLYMGTFPEDHEIRVSRLIKLWVAEGFLKPNKDQSLEEVAKDYLEDLIGRNLILIHKWKSNGDIKTCKMHDLLRDLCLRVGKKEKFLCVLRAIDVPQDMDRERRIVIHGSIPLGYPYSHALQSASCARSFICYGGPLLFKSRLLRLLNVAFVDSLETIFEKVNLRYIAYEHYLIDSEFPSSISLLWNVQTLIIRGGDQLFFAPSEIWEMPQLRHLEFDRIYLPDPPSSDQQDDFVLQNLQTLSKVVNWSCSDEVCKRIPNIKKLHIKYDYLWEEFEEISHYCVYNLGRFHQLESLRCFFDTPPNREELTFPISLKKLSLTNSRLHSEDMAMIGSLPHLEVLKLDKNSIEGPEWNTVEGGFLCLKFLEIRFCTHLIYWTADSSHFPVLEQLVLERLDKLDEIPSGIGEIPTLRVISLWRCSESAVFSAMKILEEQESLGNESLQIKVRLSTTAALERFAEKVEIMSFTGNNIQLFL